MGRYLGSAQDPGCTSVPVAGKYQLDLLYTLPIRRRWAAQAKLLAKPGTHLCPFPSMKHPRMPHAAHISQAPRTEEATPHRPVRVTPPLPPCRGLHRRGLSLSQHQSNMEKSLLWAGCICLILPQPLSEAWPPLGTSDFISILLRPPPPDLPRPPTQKIRMVEFFQRGGEGVEEGQLMVKANSVAPDEQGLAPRGQK